MNVQEWVLIRGLGREQGHWGAFRALLQEAHPESKVTCIDLPGSGDYCRLSSPFRMEGIAEFMHSHLHRGNPQERVIVAISLGAMVATEMLRLYPQSAKGFAAINTSFRNLSPVHHRLQIEALKYFYQSARAKDIESREAAIINMVSNLNDEDKQAHLQEWVRLAQERPAQPANILKQLFAAALYQAPLEKPTEDVLILTSQADRMVHPLCSQKLSEQWQVPLRSHSWAGHELCLDDPAWVVTQLGKHFIAKDLGL